MSEDELKAIEERASKATPGPWEWMRAYPPDYEGDSFLAKGMQQVGYQQETAENLPVAYADFSDPDDWESAFIAMSPSDAEFLINSQSDISSLLAYIRELQAALRDAELRGVKMGLEAAAKLCDRIAKRRLEQGDVIGSTIDLSNGHQVAACARDIRAIDPASVLNQTPTP